VLKKQGNGSFKTVGVIKYKDDLKELKSRAAQYYGAFSDLDKLGEKDFISIRDYAVKHKITDSLFMANLPVTNLVMGTAFFDSDVTEGVAYQYQVKRNPESKTATGEHLSNTVQLPAKTDILKPVFKFKQELADEIYLQWYVTEQRKLSTFALYRRVFGLGEYEKIQAKKGYNVLKDTLFIMAVDSTVKNPGYYEYYLKPMDIYGNPGPSSDVISAGPMTDATLTVPRYLRARGSEKNHEVNLSWKFGNSKYIRGIELYRSANFDSGYVKIAQLPSTDTSYVDAVPIANEVFYYYMQIQGPFEKTYPSAKISAMFKKAGDKPAPPSETAAETVRGGVKVYWTYTEPYIKGFFVFRYVYEKAAYEQVSGLIPPGSKIYSFTDSSKSLTGNQEYRYAIKAVNDVEQLSDFSVSASATAGIKATVVTPLNLSAGRKENSVLLIWDDLSKAEPNLLGYKVYRKEMNEKNFTLLPNDTLARSKNYYSDSTAVEGKSYAYAVSAIDFYGNESAKSLSAYYDKEQVVITPPTIIRAVNTDEGILVVWGQVADKNISAFKLYRGSAEGNAAVIATIKPENDQYLDKTAIKGLLYIYLISTVTGEGKESIKSSGVSVRR
jgi:fibronectin type 3 domain-containing protein